MYLLFVDRFFVKAATRHGLAYGVAGTHKVSGRQHQIGLKAFETCTVCWLKVEQRER